VPALSSRTVLAVYVLLSLAVGIYQAVLFSLGLELGRLLQFIWAAVAMLLIIFWVELDCREHREIYRPFEFGFLLLLFWLFFLPYYLLRTRRAYAALWLLGFIGLASFGYLLEWLIHLTR
jgi:hypothetical protein